MENSGAHWVRLPPIKMLCLFVYFFYLSVYLFFNYFCFLFARILLNSILIYSFCCSRWLYAHDMFKTSMQVWLVLGMLCGMEPSVYGRSLVWCQLVGVSYGMEPSYGGSLVWCQFTGVHLFWCSNLCMEEYHMFFTTCYNMLSLKWLKLVFHKSEYSGEHI